jgi:rSAM/selenodomain-associated transferase 2/rSAM/selenodomain-associated transferase 1
MNHAERSERLAVFTRFPEPGRAKTRLMPALGADGAASVHAAMVRHTLETVDAFNAARREVAVSVWHAGGDRARFEESFGPGRDYRPQAEGDLGLRMGRAFAALLDGESRVVLIGTDCPSLTEAHLHDAFEALARTDLVLGPATDGGYYLIGLRVPAPGLFSEMPWGTPEVLARTLERAGKMGLATRLLDALDDVDEPDDLPTWHGARAARLARARPWLSVVIPVRDEAAWIGRALGPVLRPGIEVIVVDGGSTDATPRLARAIGAIVVRSTPGRGTQMNAGAAVANGQALLFLHGDTIPPWNFEAVIRRELASREVALGAFRLSIDLPGWTIRLLELGVRLRCTLLGLPYGDQGFFLRAETFSRLGGFPSIPLMEDVALVRRARRIGAIRIVEEPALTSGRRWESVGVVRMTLINLGCALGSALGITPARLAAWRDRLSSTPKPPEDPGDQARHEREVDLGGDDHRRPTDRHERVVPGEREMPPGGVLEDLDGEAREGEGDGRPAEDEPATRGPSAVGPDHRRCE